jgi:hypothetical protein
MIKHSGKSSPLILMFPVLSGFGRQQMEKSVICRRNRAAKIDLFGVVRQIEFRQENSVLNQFVVIRHRSVENFFLEVRLLGLASEIEVRN